MNSPDYSIKDQQYFKNTRWDLISYLPKSNSDIRVLEIGAGGGDTLITVKTKGLAKEVVGVDIFRLENSNQDSPLVDNFIIANIETTRLPYGENYFDFILCGDVIEHLVDPWKVIEELSFYLKKGGSLIISTPNFRNWKNLKVIYIEGNFKYDPSGGLLDKTHLRFFCKKNISNLVNTKEFSFYSITSINEFPQYKFKATKRLFNLITFRIFEEFLTHQYVVVGKKR